MDYKSLAERRMDTEKDKPYLFGKCFFLLQEIHIELDKTHRGDDKYLALITQEHNVLKEIIYIWMYVFVEKLYSKHNHKLSRFLKCCFGKV